jgi:hypothetical protein
MNLVVGKGAVPVFSQVTPCRTDTMSLPVSVQFCSTMLLCDIDGDAHNELLVGSDAGELCIVKDGEISIAASALGVLRFVVDVRLHDRIAVVAALSCSGELRVLSLHSLTRLLRLHKALIVDSVAAPPVVAPLADAASESLVTLARRTVAEAAPTAIYVKPCAELAPRDWLHPELANFDRQFTSLLYIALDVRVVVSYAIGLVGGQLDCRELDFWQVPFDVVAIAPTSISSGAAGDGGAPVAAPTMVEDGSGALAMYHPALSCILVPSTASSPARTVLPQDLNMREAGVVRSGTVMVVVPTTRLIPAVGCVTGRHHVRLIWNRTRQGRVDLAEPIRGVHFGRFGPTGDVELVVVCANGVVYFYDRNQNLRRAVLHLSVRCSTAGELSVTDKNKTQRNRSVLAIINTFNELSIHQFD